MSDQIQYINKCDLLREIEAQIRVEDSFMHQVETGRIMYFSGRKAALKDLQEEIAKGKLVVAPYPLRREKPKMNKRKFYNLAQFAALLIGVIYALFGEVTHPEIFFLAAIYYKLCEIFDIFDRAAAKGETNDQ